jgi:hypothetical protein
MIDDQPDSLDALRLVLKGTRLLVRGPWDVIESDLRDVDLIVADLNLAEWDERKGSRTLATWPEDGLALIAILRAHTDRLAKPRPTSFALQSSYLDEVWGTLPSEYRAHSLARLLNLEWIFTKTESADSGLRGLQLQSLAKATNALPDSWPQGDYDATRAKVMTLLGLRQRTSWFETAWADVEQCHPPVHDLVSPSHGTVFLRWLLHRILPYPCFLWDERQLGARLGLNPMGLGDALTGIAVAAGLSSARYRGILADFLGPRWWRTGVESFLWKLTRGASSNLGAIQSALRAGGIRQEELAPGRRTICLNESFLPIAEFFGPSESVRIQPDDWPPYADPAWTSIELASTSRKLRALVIADDRGRLTTGTG